MSRASTANFHPSAQSLELPVGWTHVRINYQSNATHRCLGDQGRMEHRLIAGGAKSNNETS